MSIGLLEIDEETGLNVYTHDLSDFEGKNITINIAGQSSLVLIDTDNDVVIYEYDDIFILRIKNYDRYTKIIGIDNSPIMFEFVDCGINDLVVECHIPCVYFIGGHACNFELNNGDIDNIIFIDVNLLSLYFYFLSGTTKSMEFHSCVTDVEGGDIYIEHVDRLVFDKCELYGEIIGTTVDNLILSNGNYIEHLYAFTKHVQLDSDTVVEKAYVSKDSSFNGVYACIGGEDRPLSDIGYEAFEYLSSLS